MTSIACAPDLYDPYHYGWMQFNYFLLFWALSHAVRQLFQQFLPSETIRNKFSDLSEDKKRNVVTYILQFIVTLFAFIAQLYGGYDILFNHENDITNTSLLHLDWASLALQAITVLYVWELVYREVIGYPLLIHHILTLLLIQLAVASFHDTGLILYLRLALLLGFHATTEQISFVALLCFRLDIFPKHQAFLFNASALQAFVCKTLVTVVFVYFYVIDLNAIKESGSWGWFWAITIVPLVLMLYAAQLYAIYVLFILGKRTKQPEEEDNSMAPEDEDTARKLASSRGGRRRNHTRHSSLILLENMENSLKATDRISTRMEERFSYVQGDEVPQGSSSIILDASDEELGAPIDSSIDKP